MAVAERYRTGIMRPTPLMCRIAAAIEQAAPVLVVVDNVAATFAGNQNDRVIRPLLRQPLAPASPTARASPPCCCSTTRAYPGSPTAAAAAATWTGATRSAPPCGCTQPRTRPKPSAVSASSRRQRAITARPGNPIRLQWADGGLQLEHAPTSLHRIAKDAECDETFLRLLDERAGQGLDVSAKPSVLYAPKVFADMPNNGGFAKRAFADAMQRLLQSGKIVQRTDGPQSRRRSRLVRKPAA